MFVHSPLQFKLSTSRTIKAFWSLNTFLAEIEEAIAAAVQDADRDPRSLREAQSCSDWPCWKDVMDREIQSLQQAGTWETVPCPPDKNIVSCKWVYRLKCRADGTTDKYKARLVV